MIFRFSTGEAFAPADPDCLLSRSFDSIKFPLIKGDMETQLFSRGLYKVTVGTEDEPSSAIEKTRFLNKKDEAFGFLCLFISRDLLFHLAGLKTPK